MGRKNNRVIERYWTENTYDDKDRFLTHTDHVTNEKTAYTYDSEDRVTAVLATKPDGSAIENGLLRSEANYGNGLLTSARAVIKADAVSETLTTRYDYTDAASNPKLSKVTLPNAREVEYARDGFGRTTEKRWLREAEPGALPPYAKSNHLFVQKYDYRSVEGSTQDLIAAERYGINGRLGERTKYRYDESGRVTGIDSTGYGMVEYEYDEAGRVKRENNALLNATFVYDYDGNGNILSKQEYAYTKEGLEDKRYRSFVPYNYATDWQDQMTSYNGEPCTYDEIGNPTLYRGKRLEWEKCRRLKSYRVGTDRQVVGVLEMGLESDRERNRVRSIDRGGSGAVSGAGSASDRRGTDRQYWIVGQFKI